MIIRPEAEDDLRSARDWYEGRQVGLGDEFGAEVDAALKRLETMPLVLAPVYKQFCRFFVRRFMYVIYYFMDDDEMIVFVILHMHRDAKVWRSRIE